MRTLAIDAHIPNIRPTTALEPGLRAMEVQVKRYDIKGP